MTEIEKLRELLREVRSYFKNMPVGMAGRIDAALSQQAEPAHDLYQTGDLTAPDAIKDLHGDVVLALCKRCGQGEAELEATCPGKAEPAPAQGEPWAYGWESRDKTRAQVDRSPHGGTWFPLFRRPAQTEQQPVAAQIRYRHPQKTMPAWSAWQQAPVDMTKPTWWIDSVGYENEYRLLYATRPAQTEQQPCAKIEVRRDAEGRLSAKVCAFEASLLPVGQMVALYAAPIAQTAPQHPDDAAVDRFAAAMKAKLAKSRAKGRGGWDNPNVCSVEFLAQLLVEHLGKGNAGTFEDVANFAMMLHQRGADPMVLANATRPAQTGQQPVAVPEGWKLVPVQPTAEMLAAVTTSTFEPLRQEAMKTAREDYQAMLNAAPIAQTAPQPEQSGLHSAVRAYLAAIDNGSDEYDVRRARSGVRHALSTRGAPNDPAA